MMMKLLVSIHSSFSYTTTLLSNCGASSASNNNRREKFHVSAMSVKKNTLKNYEGMVLLRPDVENPSNKYNWINGTWSATKALRSKSRRGLQNNMYNIKGYGRVPGAVGHLVHAGND